MKCLLVLSLALFSAQASAEWTYVVESDTNMYFLDKSTIRDKVKFIDLVPDTVAQDVFKVACAK